MSETSLCSYAFDQHSLRYEDEKAFVLNLNASLSNFLGGSSGTKKTNTRLFQPTSELEQVRLVIDRQESFQKVNE